MIRSLPVIVKQAARDGLRPFSVIGHQSSLDAQSAFMPFRGTKIVATIGPSVIHRLPQLLSAGVNVGRINCAHGDAAQYMGMSEALRKAEEEVRRVGTSSFEADALALQVRGRETGERGAMWGLRFVSLLQATKLVLARSSIHHVVVFQRLYCLCERRRRAARASAPSASTSRAPRWEQPCATHAGATLLIYDAPAALTLAFPLIFPPPSSSSSSSDPHGPLRPGARAGGPGRRAGGSRRAGRHRANHDGPGYG